MDVAPLIFQFHHKPEWFVELLQNHMVRPDQIVSAVLDGIEFQKRTFGPEYGDYDVTKNLRRLLTYVEEFTASSQVKLGKRMRPESENDILPNKKKRI